MYSIDKRTGKKVDAHLHAEILQSVDPRDDQRMRKETRRRAAKAYGMTPEQLDEAYGEDSR